MALETFKAQLKAKAKTLGVTNLSNKRIDAYAATLDKQNPNLSTDDDHAEKVDSFLEIVDIKEVAAFDDYQRSKAAGKKDGKEGKEGTPESGKEGDGKQDSPATGDDVPAWAKTLIEQNKTLAETVQKLQAKETRQTVEQRLKETLKDIPARFYQNWQLPEKEEDFEAFTERVKTEYAEFQKEAGITTPQGGTGGTAARHTPGRSTGGSSDKVDEKELDAILDKI